MLFGGCSIGKKDALISRKYTAVVFVFIIIALIAAIHASELISLFSNFHLLRIHSFYYVNNNINQTHDKWNAINYSSYSTMTNNEQILFSFMNNNFHKYDKYHDIPKILINIGVRSAGTTEFQSFITDQLKFEITCFKVKQTHLNQLNHGVLQCREAHYWDGKDCVNVNSTKSIANNTNNSITYDVFTDLATNSRCNC